MFNVDSENSYNNLIKFGEMTPERHRELSARGGRASGEKRRQTAEIRRVFYASWEADVIRMGLREELQEFYRWKNQRKRKRA